MNCNIISLHKKQKFQGLGSVTLPAAYGEMQVLPGHADSFVVLQAGTVILKDNKEIPISITKSVCYIKDDEILIIQ